MDEVIKIYKKYRLKIIGLFLLVILSLPIIIYRVRYGVFILDANPEDYAYWADFLNPFISFINICLLVFLTLEVKRIEEKRDTEREKLEEKRDTEREKSEEKRLNKSLDVQKRITLSQMRNEKLISLSINLDKINNSFDYSLEKNIQLVKEIEQEFNSFNKMSKYLFADIFTEPKFNETYIKLENCFSVIRKTILDCVVAMNSLKSHENATIKNHPLYNNIVATAYKEGKTIEEKFNEIEEKTQERSSLALTVGIKNSAAKEALNDYLLCKDLYIQNLNSFILNELEK